MTEAREDHAIRQRRHKVKRGKPKNEPERLFLCAEIGRLMAANQSSEASA